MTREEAIEVIKLAMAQVEWDYPMDYAAAFDMAIKALEQEPTTKNDLGVDCISRQAVIDSLYDWSNHSMTDAETWHLRQVIGDIKSMPSVIPQETFKPMVEIDLYSVIKQKYIEREVLDKIRAEIKALTSNRGFLSCDVDYIHEEIDAVFDKYKAESEPQESEG